MTKKKLIKIELMNPRFTRMELREHASEFIHYARYAGYMLPEFNKHLSDAKIYPLAPEIAERNHRLILETTHENAKTLYQITKIYPSFKTWKVKVVSSDINLEQESSKPKQEKPSKAAHAKKEKPSAKKITEKKPASKKVAKKASTTTKKPLKKSSPATAKAKKGTTPKKTATKTVKTGKSKKSSPKKSKK